MQYLWRTEEGSRPPTPTLKEIEKQAFVSLLGVGN